MSIEDKLIKIAENQQQVYAAGAKSQSIIPEVSGESILLTDSSNYPLENLKVYGKSTQDGTPTPEAPIDIVSAGASGSVEVKVCGANLFNAVGRKYDSYDGTKAEVLENGKIIKCATTEKGTQWSQCGIGNLNLIAGQQYTVVLDKITSTHKSSIELRDGKGKNQGFGTKPYTFTAQEGCTYTFRFILNSTETNLNATVTATYEGLRIIAGDTVVPWEEYKEPQTLTLATPNELRAVPVVNAEQNYTFVDGNGQKWVCDYIDLEKGVKVENIVVLTLNGNSGWVKSGSSDTKFEARCSIQADLTPQLTRGGYSNLLPHQNLASGVVNSYNVGWNNVYAGFDGTYFGGTVPTLEDIKALLNENPITVYTYRTTPIETPLTAEEIAYYKALHTNYPNTTIFNTDGTNMDVFYVADTKLYIDNKFAELQALALEG